MPLLAAPRRLQMPRHAGHADPSSGAVAVARKLGTLNITGAVIWCRPLIFAARTLMSYQKLILLAPCHGLEDFPLYHTGEDAASLLACWTALWHPLLVQSARELPRVERCDYPPEDLRDALLLLPRPCEGEMDADLPESAERQGATLLTGYTHRDDLLRQVLEPLGDAPRALDAEIVKDFLAFGFAFLQVELLTQQMRYASSIDQTRIERILKEAAEAALTQDLDLCREKLTSAHDALADERSHYYPVDVYLLDLTMLAPAPATLGASLDRQLQWDGPQNVLASGESIGMLAERNPAALELIREGLQQNRIGLAGGEFEELPIAMMTMESFEAQLRKGDAVYRTHLGASPSTFGRRRSGIYPSLLHPLRSAHFDSAIHFKFDEGHYPEGSQTRTRWQGGNGEGLDIFARAPLDASSHETFLNLPSQLSDTMDTDHVAAKMFLHWPGHEAPWYDDLRRCHRYGNALGRFVTLREFFDASGDTAASEEFRADDYRYPYLKQAAASKAPNPISQWSDYWHQAVRHLAARGLKGLHHVLAADASHSLGTVEEDTTDVEARIQAACGALSDVLTDEQAATTVINPFSFPRRVVLESTSPTTLAGAGVYASETHADGCRTVVDVPAMGFARVSPGEAPPLKGPLLADGLTLKNEFFQAIIDQETGALRSLRDYQSRSTRISQQVGLRITLPKTGQAWVDRQAPIGYSVMAADEVRIEENGRIRASIVARGRLLALNGEQVGAFQQTYTATRGDRILTIDIELETQDDLLLPDDPWDSYYASRFAFGDEAAVLRAGSRLQVHDVSRRRLEAPLLVDIDGSHGRTTILSGGLPYHRRVTDSQLDTILRVPGESRSRFRLGIGLDLPSSVRGAIDFLCDDLATSVSGATASETGWLFHVDARNVVVSSWADAGSRRIWLRVVESEGRSSQVRLACCKPIQSAHRTNAQHDELEAFEVAEGIASFEIHPHQACDVLIRW